MPESGNPFSKTLQKIERLNEVMEENRKLGIECLDGIATEENKAALGRFAQASFDKNKLTTSIHESAHAFVFLSKGIEFEKITIISRTIETDNGVLLVHGHVAMPELLSATSLSAKEYKNCLIGIAAGVAIERFLNNTIDESAGTDINILRQATNNNDAEIESLIAEAMNYIISDSDLIEEIAERLRELETLYFNDIAAIVTGLDQ